MNQRGRWKDAVIARRERTCGLGNDEAEMARAQSARAKTPALRRGFEVASTTEGVAELAGLNFHLSMIFFRPCFARRSGRREGGKPDPARIKSGAGFSGSCSRADRESGRSRSAQAGAAPY